MMMQHFCHKRSVNSKIKKKIHSSKSLLHYHSKNDSNNSMTRAVRMHRTPSHVLLMHVHMSAKLSSSCHGVGAANRIKILSSFDC